MDGDGYSQSVWESTRRLNSDRNVPACSVCSRARSATETYPTYTRLDTQLFYLLHTMGDVKLACSSIILTPWTCRLRNHLLVYGARPVRRQTYGYLPSRRACITLPCYQPVHYTGCWQIKRRLVWTHDLWVVTTLPSRLTIRRPDQATTNIQTNVHVIGPILIWWTSTIL